MNTTVVNEVINEKHKMMNLLSKDKDVNKAAGHVCPVLMLITLMYDASLKPRLNYNCF